MASNIVDQAPNSMTLNGIEKGHCLWGDLLDPVWIEAGRITNPDQVAIQWMKIADVSRLTGLNRSTVTALYQENAKRIDLDAIDQLCRLFECDVSDLLEYVPDDRQA